MNDSNHASRDTHRDAGSAAKRFVGVSGYVAKLPRGERAELRRLSGKAVPNAVFWRIVERYEIQPGQEPFWTSIIPLMVKLKHRNGASPGKALAAAGVSQPRVERWLRMDESSARVELRRLFAQIDGPVDWVKLGFLMRDWEQPGRGDQLKRELARDFFLSPQLREKLEEDS